MSLWEASNLWPQAHLLYWAHHAGGRCSCHRPYLKYIVQQGAADPHLPLSNHTLSPNALLLTLPIHPSLTPSLSFLLFSSSTSLCLTHFYFFPHPNLIHHFLCLLTISLTNPSLLLFTHSVVLSLHPSLIGVSPHLIFFPALSPTPFTCTSLNSLASSLHPSLSHSSLLVLCAMLMPAGESPGSATLRQRGLYCSHSLLPLGQVLLPLSIKMH